ncbi:hypothetical protein KKF25_02425 [Patescibacteria group bacterium]|nr:hypothetical protein [Patescibacteria group bacterium]
MSFIADFHIHSKYSRATSKDMDLENLDKWARLKGVDLLGTGDFTHPAWLKELKGKLEPCEPGLFKLRKVNKIKLNNGWQLPNGNGSNADLRFILTSEISCIYKKKDRTRKAHIMVFVSSFEAVEKINAHLGWIGNLKADGRPILGLDAKELAKIVLNISPEALVVPAHIWTPHFSVFGSESGFDSLQECFDEYTRYIYALETGLSCYDKQTEVLTDNGWKKFTAVDYTDKICSLNIKTNEIEFQNPTKIHSYSYKGKMYKLKTKRIDLLVTPNHKLLYSPCDFRKPPKFLLKEAEFLFNKSKRFKKDGIWNGKNEEYFILPAVKIKHGSQHYSGLRDKKEKLLPIIPWLKFFGFWIAEGWTTNGKEGDYNVCLANKNSHLLLEMKEILENFGYSVYWDKKIGIVRVRDFQLFFYLKKFGKCFNKFIPSEIKCLSKEFLEIFLQYYIKGDGHIYGRGGKGLSATTTSIYLRDDLQEIALKVGMSAYYKLHREKGTPFKSPGYGYKKVYKQRNDSWVIYFIRKNIHAIMPSIIKKNNHIESWVDFDNLVYCVTVPNHVIYVRRNGIPVWCGNSDPAMNWRLSQIDNLSLISNSDSHSPHRIGREANVFEGQIEGYRYIAEALRLGVKAPSSIKNRLVKTIEFFPEEGRYHYDGHRNCKIAWSPAETKKHNGICSVCGKRVTVGVMNRVDALADRPPGGQPSQTVPYINLIPLEEIIADAFSVGVGTKKVDAEYQGLINKFGQEFKILMDLPKEELLKAAKIEVAEAIIRVREGKVKIEPGYDGEYGKVQIYDDAERQGFTKQNALF